MESLRCRPKVVPTSPSRKMQFLLRLCVSLRVFFDLPNSAVARANGVRTLAKSGGGGTKICTKNWFSDLVRLQLCVIFKIRPAAFFSSFRLRPIIAWKSISTAVIAINRTTKILLRKVKQKQFFCRKTVWFSPPSEQTDAHCGIVSNPDFLFPLNSWL